jgi:phosphoglycolate phosphatase-like HAD superfamily hydrolase
MGTEEIIKTSNMAIFDLDGTLINLKVDWNGLYDELSDIANDWGHVGRFHHLLDAYKWVEKRPEVKDLLVQKQAEYELRDIDLHQKVTNGLSAANWRLKHGSKCSILSLNTSFAIERILGGRGFFPLVTIDRVQRPKPDPMGVKMIMNTEGYGHGEVIFIGNSHIDEETASAAGVLFIHIDDVKEEWFHEDRPQ